jgi:hypothetical protein
LLSTIAFSKLNSVDKVPCLLHAPLAEKDSRARRRRVLTVVQSSSSSTTSSSEFRPLAPKSDRIDPLDHFRKYKDGYNLKSKHYWAVKLMDSN